MPAINPVIVPSDLAPYLDWYKFGTLLCTRTTDKPPNTLAELDANALAKELVRSAYNEILQAVLKGEKYSLDQIKDLVLDFIASKESRPSANLGQQIVTLVADLAWAAAVRRKRYVKESPQGVDPSVEKSKEDLDRLRRGERIFILDGVDVTDSTGNPQVPPVKYGKEIEVAGHTVGGSLLNNSHCPTGLWGCESHCDDLGRGRSRGGCC